MRHGVKKNQLGRTAGHAKAMLGNLATSVLKQGLQGAQPDRQVRTTLAKAKTVRPLVERLITFAKKGDLSARREAARVVHDHEVLKGLFETIGPRYRERQGGYTRVLKLGLERAGDAATMAIIELVEDQVVAKAKSAKAKPVKAAAKKKIDITEKAPAEAAGSEPKA